VFLTNSSSFLPSELADATGRPDRLLALHFANQVWKHNVAEIMGSDLTDPAVTAATVGFARSIGMVPIEVRKEQRGYVLNSLLSPLLHAAANLLLRGVADPATIDTTWRVATGSPYGPFETFDTVVLRTAHAVADASSNTAAQAWAAYLQEHYLTQGKFGVEFGEGFYTHPLTP